MARVILYISNDVYDKVNAIVEKRRQEGARDKDISLSGTASMLLELGLRVYDAQMERKESAFNQTEFNKLLLECVVKTQSTVAKILGIESLSPHVSGIQSLICEYGRRYQGKSVIGNGEILSKNDEE